MGRSKRRKKWHNHKWSGRCRKMLYKSERAALKMIELRHQDVETAMRVYFCAPCMGYHLTSRHDRFETQPAGDNSVDSDGQSDT